MFTIPATVLGTKQDVEVRDVGGNPGAALFKSRYTNAYPSIGVSFNSLTDLLAWTKTLPQTQLDQLAEFFLPTAQYTSVWMDCSLYTWGPMAANAATSLAPASAFQVNDLVVWSPRKPIAQPHSLVAGGTYAIIGCAFQGPPACWSLACYQGGALVSVADEDELTLCGQPSTKQLTLPLEPSTVGSYTPPAKKCECGAAKCKSNIHSTWCPMA